MKLAHYCSLSSNPANDPRYPAGYDRRTLAIGPLALIPIAERVKRLCPQATMFIWDNPWGKHLIDGVWSTVLDQRTRAAAMGGVMRRMIDPDGLWTAAHAIREMGFAFRVYLGWPPSMSEHQFIAEILPLAALGIVTYIDGNGRRPETHPWMAEHAERWGMPGLGIEPTAIPGSVLDSPRYPALVTAVQHYSDPRPMMNETVLQWRGSGTPIDGTAARAVETCKMRALTLAMHLAPTDDDARGLQDLADVRAEIGAEGAAT